MEVTTAIQQLQHQIERLQLGFIDIRYKVVYCNRRCEGALWYMVEDGQQVPVQQNALRGYAERLEIVNLQRRGKDTDKLQFTLNCGDVHFVLEAGADSEFAQSLVYALAVLPPQQLKQPVIIQPEPGDDSAVLFAKVRTSDYRRVFVERAKQGSYEQALEQAIANVSAASGARPRSEMAEPTQQSSEPEPSQTSAPDPIAELPDSDSSDLELSYAVPDPATRFQTIAAWTGHKPSQLRAIAKQAQLPASSADMTLEQQTAMRDAIFFNWALQYPLWQQSDDCWRTYQDLIGKLPADATDAKIWEKWKRAITQRLARQQRQSQKPLVTAS
jgi:hypothetical protein